MISIIRNFFILLALLAAASCGKNEFDMEISLPGTTNANYQVTYYASDKRGGITVETAVAVANGKGILKGIAKNPALMYLRSPAGREIGIYVERGDKIKITGQDTDPITWNVEGNDLNKQWTEWRIRNAVALHSDKPDEINKAVAAYVTDHPSDPLSTLLLLTSFSRIDDETLFRSLWLKLKDDARDNKWTALVGRTDIPYNYVTTPAKLLSIALRSAGNGIDTVRTDSVKATMLFFWYAGIPDRQEHIDSLRAIVKEFPDSAKRMIADICLDHDSVSWRMPVRRDSLTKVVRGWLPAGLADSRIMSLDVRRAPFYIVFSQDGNQRYRGSDPSEALSTFRTLMK